MKPSVYGPWRRTWTADGVSFTLRNAPDNGEIRVTHARPLRSLRRVVLDAVGARDGGDGDRDALLLELLDLGAVARALEAAGQAVEDARALVTKEGEHCALFSVASGERRQHLGVIFGDRHLSIVHARHTRDCSAGALFRDFCCAATLEFPLRLGWQRPRRYLFTPPAGWRVAGTCDLTLRLEAPDASLSLIVPPAMPTGPHPELDRLLYDQALVGFRPSAEMERHPVRLRSGLHGQHIVAVGRHCDSAGPVRVYGAVVTDSRFKYALHLTPLGRPGASDDARMLALLERILASIVPVPVPGGLAERETTTAELFGGYH
jgi:hypothetical protein